MTTPANKRMHLPVAASRRPQVMRRVDMAEERQRGTRVNPIIERPEMNDDTDAEVLPCIFDASVFASFEKTEKKSNHALQPTPLSRRG